ncbi:MAG TPA: inositol monophosphatase family protein [Sphaerochaeta sp.]|nr:inositol monophosphatase family protein [Sphaerochaeta sp.]
MIERRLDVALLAARKAGAYLLASDKAAAFTVVEKATNDYLTDADTASEAVIIETIARHLPDDAIFAEERGVIGDTSKGRWIIDPIDGTMNFARSIPGYTVSIAWEEEPFNPLIGVVYNVRQDELFWAARGHGAFLNDQRISVSQTKEARRCLIATVPPHRHHEFYEEYALISRRLALGTSDFRSYGSCALEMSYIACGRIDAFYEMWLGYYDLAAGMAIVREAGGEVTAAHPERPLTDQRCDLLASNGLLHQEISSMVQA